MSASISGIESRVVSSSVPETKRTRNGSAERRASTVAAGTTEKTERTRAPVVEKTVRKAYPKTERSRASAEFRENALEEALERRRKQARESGFSLDFEFLWETGREKDEDIPSLGVYLVSDDRNADAGTMKRDQRTVVRVIPAADIKRFISLSAEGEPSGGLFEMFF